MGVGGDVQEAFAQGNALTHTHTYTHTLRWYYIHTGEYIIQNAYFVSEPFRIGMNKCLCFGPKDPGET